MYDYQYCLNYEGCSYCYNTKTKTFVVFKLGQNNLDTLSNFSESTDNTSSDSEDENEGLFAYLTQTMKEKRVGNCASSNHTSIICLKFLYPVHAIFKIVP